MADYKHPGVYIEEIQKLPPSITSVETAIPAFIGYTEKAQLKKVDDLILEPQEITSMLDYQFYFGNAQPEKGIVVNIDRSDPNRINIQGDIDPTSRSKYLMFYSLQMFFANGGGRCFIVSVGKYADGGVIDLNALQAGLDKIRTVEDVTLILFPDGLGMSVGDYYTLNNLAMQQCFELQDRFAVMDVWVPAVKDPAFNQVQQFRDSITPELNLKKYGAAYYPRIYSQLDYYYTDESVIKITGGPKDNLKDLQAEENALYNQVKAAIQQIDILMPASSAVVGKYADTDNSRGVWKAPANVNLIYASRPELPITNAQQDLLNIDTKDGKSINVIRSFPGRGSAIIWGARTLAGNDNEWRYIPVRRFFNMVEESTKNATEQFVFEPNDANTWVRVKAMIENYLTQQWKAGALMGANPQQAFFVHVGLNETMNELDIWEGRMIIEIGMAVVRPAEFIILRFMHKMLAES